MANVEDVFEGLVRPFDEEKVSWRTQSMGKSNGRLWVRMIPYIDARDVMNRLDEVLGPYNWQSKLETFGEYTKCSLGLFINNNWIWKEDVGENTNTAPYKGAASDSLKRAACQWGVGRYLYDEDSKFAEIVEKGTRGALYGSGTVKSGNSKERIDFYYLKPRLGNYKKGPSMDPPKKINQEITQLKNSNNSNTNSGYNSPKNYAPGSNEDIDAFLNAPMPEFN